MKLIFVDTAPLIAINNPDDQYFEPTQLFYKTLRQDKITIITSDYCIDEALTGLITRVKKGGYYLGMNLIKWIFHSHPSLSIEWITPERFYQARKVFERFNKDKTWSFTDCTSFVVMKELGIKTAFSFDEEFAQMGFEILR